MSGEGQGWEGWYLREGLGGDPPAWVQGQELPAWDLEADLEERGEHTGMGSHPHLQEVGDVARKGWSFGGPFL